MIQKIKYSLVLILTILSLVGCRDVDDYSGGNDDDEENIPKIQVNFVAKLPGADAVEPTKAYTPGDENAIKRVDILVFERVGSTEVYSYYTAASTPTVVGKLANFTTYLRVSKGTEKYRIVVLANIQESVIKNAGLKKGDSKEAVLAKLRFAPGTQWESGTSYIPMWGQMPDASRVYEGMDIKEDMGVLPLVRSLASVSVEVTDPNFTMSSVKVVNSHNLASVAPRYDYFDFVKTRAVKPSVPLEAAYTPAYDVAATNNKIVNSIYIAEAWNKKYAGSSEAVCLIVKGQRKDAAVDIFYRIDFIGAEGPFDILRNHTYKVLLSNLSGKGYATEKEAFEAVPVSNNNAVVLAWDVNNPGEIISDGEFHVFFNMGVVYVNYKEGTDETLVASHDYPNPDRIAFEFNCYDPVSGEKSDWITMTPNGKASPIKYSLAYKLNEFNTRRVAEIFTIVGNVSKKIKVIQKPVPIDEYFDVEGWRPGGSNGNSGNTGSNDGGGSWGNNNGGTGTGSGGEGNSGDWTPEGDKGNAGNTGGGGTGSDWDDNNGGTNTGSGGNGSAGSWMEENQKVNVGNAGGGGSSGGWNNGNGSTTGGGTGGGGTSDGWKPGGGNGNAGDNGSNSGGNGSWNNGDGSTTGGGTGGGGTSDGWKPGGGNGNAGDNGSNSGGGSWNNGGGSTTGGATGGAGTGGAWNNKGETGNAGDAGSSSGGNGSWNNGGGSTTGGATGGAGTSDGWKPGGGNGNAGDNGSSSGGNGSWNNGGGSTTGGATGGAGTGGAWNNKGETGNAGDAGSSSGGGLWNGNKGSGTAGGTGGAGGAGGWGSGGIITDNVGTEQVLLEYNLNGGSGGPYPLSEMRWTGVNIPLSTQLVTPANSQYIFVGWTEASDGSGTVHKSGEMYTMPNVNTVLYAKFTKIQYTMSFDVNTSSGGKGITPRAIQAEGGATVTLPKSGPDHDVLTFAGWCESIDAATDIYLPNSQYTMPAKNVTLYAVYSNNPIIGKLMVAYFNGNDPRIAEAEVVGVGWQQAVNLSRDVGTSPREGWRLPTVAELQIMYANKAYLESFKNAHKFRVLAEGGSSTDFYWSSEVQDELYVDGLFMNSGRKLKYVNFSLMGWRYVRDLK